MSSTKQTKSIVRRFLSNFRTQKQRDLKSDLKSDLKRKNSPGYQNRKDEFIKKYNSDIKKETDNLLNIMKSEIKHSQTPIKKIGGKKNKTKRCKYRKTQKK